MGEFGDLFAGEFVEEPVAGEAALRIDEDPGAVIGGGFGEGADFCAVGGDVAFGVFELGGGGLDGGEHCFGGLVAC